MAGLIRISVNADMDATKAVLFSIEQAGAAGFSEVEGRKIATAASELARNILHHAGCGEIRLRIFDERGRRGIEIEARDNGPGIADIEQAMGEHFSTAGTLGLGLPGVRRLMDELDIESEPGAGTCVTARKFL